MLEKLEFSLWIEIWGDVDTQRSMSFLNGLLDELFWWAGWCGPDGECGRVVNKLAQFVGGDQAKATFGDGEGSPRCSVGVVG